MGESYIKILLKAQPGFAVFWLILGWLTQGYTLDALLFAAACTAIGFVGGLLIWPLMPIADWLGRH